MQRYSGLPLWGETIIVKTWPRGTDKLFALRDYEVRYPDGRSIALATSSWLIIDREYKTDPETGQYSEHI